MKVVLHWDFLSRGFVQLDSKWCPPVWYKIIPSLSNKSEDKSEDKCPRLRGPPVGQHSTAAQLTSRLFHRKERRVWWNGCMNNSCLSLNVDFPIVQDTFPENIIPWKLVLRNFFQWYTLVKPHSSKLFLEKISKAVFSCKTLKHLQIIKNNTLEVLKKWNTSK